MLRFGNNINFILTSLDYLTEASNVIKRVFKKFLFGGFKSKKLPQNDHSWLPQTNKVWKNLLVINVTYPFIRKPSISFSLIFSLRQNKIVELELKFNLYTLNYCICWSWKCYCLVYLVFFDTDSMYDLT
jgi:hypothetical protein